MLRDDQLALLQGLPGHWRYALTGLQDDVKKCFEESWNEKGRGHTLESVFRLNSSPSPSERWRSRRMIGLGVITGEESQGLLVIDFDGVGSQAVRAFRSHFRHWPSQLPHTLTTISGKKGRAKAFFSVPPYWWEKLHARSAVWKEDGNVVLEAIWQNTTGAGRHAVICGDHPDSSHQRPLHYRWLPGNGPGEAEVSEAPEWLILGVLAQSESTHSERTGNERQRNGEDDATPWERLTAFERRELVESALPFCPNRLAKGSGTYERARRVMCAVLNEFGLDTATTILSESEWNKKNEWDSSTDCSRTLASLANSKIAEDQKSRIASVFFFARDAGWTPPGWAIPPVELKTQVESFKKLINQYLDSQGDSAALATIMGRGRREFGVEPDRLRSLALEHVLGTIDRMAPKTISEVTAKIRKDNIYSDVIDGFLGRSVHVVAGASHSGKTTLAAFLANRVIHGASVDIDAIRHSVTAPGKVLIFSSDCSDSEMVRELALEGVDARAAGDRLRICSGITFDDMIFIAKSLDDFAPDLVIYDCLTSMSCRDSKLSDSSYADPIRELTRHNGHAWPQCAHLILHHTTRDEPTRFSGTEQIKAAAQEMWLYYPPELLTWRKGQPRPVIGPTRHLVFEKSRGGYQGKLVAVTRDAYQSSWQFRRQGQDSTPLDSLRIKFRSVEHDKWQIASEWAKELDLEFSSRSLRRYLDHLVGTLLETSKLRSHVTGRLDTHYRPRDVVRTAAQQMVSSRGDGINVV